MLYLHVLSVGTINIDPSFTHICWFRNISICLYDITAVLQFSPWMWLVLTFKLLVQTANHSPAWVPAGIIYVWLCMPCMQKRKCPFRLIWTPVAPMLAAFPQLQGIACKWDLLHGLPFISFSALSYKRKREGGWGNIPPNGNADNGNMYHREPAGGSANQALMLSATILCVWIVFE